MKSNPDQSDTNEDGVGDACEIRTLLIGNSITAGVISGGGERSYVDVLTDELGPEFEILEAGCSGSSILDWLRPPADPLPCPIAGAYEIRAIQHLPVEVAVIELGGNDAVGFFEIGPTPIDIFRESVDALIARLFNDQVKKVVLFTPPPNPGRNDSVNLRLQEYGNAIKTFCNSTTIICGPDLFTLLDPETDFEGKNVHPNEGGHYKMGMALAEVLNEITDLIK